MNKYLEKIAGKYDNQHKYMNTLFRRYSKGRANLKLVGGRALAGSTIGGTLGYGASLPDRGIYDKKNKSFSTRPSTTPEKVRVTISGALLGGVFGASSGTKRVIRNFENRFNSGTHRAKFHKRFSTAGSRSYSHRNVSDIMRDMGATPSQFKTKAEATKHYRRQAMKHHPDRGGSRETMQKLNDAFEEYKKHPDGFEKLAGYKYLNKIVQLNSGNA